MNIDELIKMGEEVRRLEKEEDNKKKREEEEIRKRRNETWEKIQETAKELNYKFGKLLDDGTYGNLEKKGNCWYLNKSCTYAIAIFNTTMYIGTYDELINSHPRNPAFSGNFIFVRDLNNIIDNWDTYYNEEKVYEDIMKSFNRRLEKIDG